MAGPTLPGQSDPMGAPSLIPPRSPQCRGNGQEQGGAEQDAGFEACSLDPRKFKAEASAPPFPEDVCMGRGVTVYV